MTTAPTEGEALLDGRLAWTRLGATVALATIGCVGMWSVAVVLAPVGAEFGAGRAGASVPYVVTMLAFGAGGIAMGRVADRTGVMPPVVAGTLLLALGYALAGLAPTLGLFAAAHALVGLGASAVFSPLVADASLWFRRRRGIAVAIAASGNYLAGVVWPPLLTALVAGQGWRATHLMVAAACLVLMLPLAAVLRRRAPGTRGGAALPPETREVRPLGLSRAALTALLCAAGVACCVAMAMPQVHIVAYCGELGYGAAQGAAMLSLMLGFGIASRLLFGLLSDRIGGLRTLLAGSFLQAVALALYLVFDGLAALFVVSALFGLFQGGIVPAYAVAVRELFPLREVGARTGTVLGATLVGMALGGWLSGVVFDATGSYQAAFLNGIAWNALNLLVVASLLLRAGRHGRGDHASVSREARAA